MPILRLSTKIGVTDRSFLAIGFADQSYSSQVESIVSNVLDFMSIDTRAPYVAVLVDDTIIDVGLIGFIKTNEIMCLGSLHDAQMSNYIQLASKSLEYVLYNYFQSHERTN